MIDQLARFFVRIDLHHFTDLETLFLATRGVDLVKDVLQLVFKIVHAFRTDHVEDGSGACHISFNGLVVQTAGTQIFAEATASGAFHGHRSRLTFDGSGRRQKKIKHAFLSLFASARHHALFLLRFNELDASLHQIAHD